MIKTFTRSLCSLQNVHIIIAALSILFILFGTAAEGHALRTKREIIESGDHINETITDSNVENVPVVDYVEDIQKDLADDEPIKQQSQHNETTSTTTDVNNVIEQNFDHKIDAASAVNNGTSIDLSNAASNRTSSAKEISQESHESRENR